jgi:hypothetical protein
MEKHEITQSHAAKKRRTKAFLITSQSIMGISEKLDTHSLSCCSMPGKPPRCPTAQASWPNKLANLPSIAPGLVCIARLYVATSSFVISITIPGSPRSTMHLITVTYASKSDDANLPGCSSARLVLYSEFRSWIAGQLCAHLMFLSRRCPNILLSEALCSFARSAAAPYPQFLSLWWSRHQSLSYQLM